MRWGERRLAGGRVSGRVCVCVCVCVCVGGVGVCWWGGCVLVGWVGRVEVWG